MVTLGYRVWCDNWWSHVLDDVIINDVIINDVIVCLLDTKLVAEGTRRQADSWRDTGYQIATGKSVSTWLPCGYHNNMYDIQLMERYIQDEGEEDTTAATHAKYVNTNTLLLYQYIW